jgi:hypothetical protein
MIKLIFGELYDKKLSCKVREGLMKISYFTKKYDYRS